MTTRAATRAEKRRTTFRRTGTPSDPRNRLVGLLVLFVIIGAGFVAVLVDLQAVRPEENVSYGESQRYRTRQIAAYRGAVLDRNGFALAVSTPAHKVVADPTLIVDPVATAGLLAPILGVDSAVLTEQLTPDSDNDRYALLAGTVDGETVAGIQLLEDDKELSEALVGVFVRPEEDRVYPAGELAGAVVGRVDIDEQGIYGIEEIYNTEMTGEPGTEQFEVGRFGSISVGDYSVTEATAGNNLVLTIDQRIQYVAEQALVEHCEATGADGATAVMADPRTGEILALAAARRDEGGCYVPNYAAGLVDAFEPGSVIKPVVVAAAFEELGYTGDTVVDVPSRISVGGKTFVDHPEHPPAPFAITQIVAESMNVGIILLAQRLGADAVHGYLTDFGFGQPTGLEWSGESTGRLRATEDWWGADHASIPIGQGMSVNATQLLGAYNVLANGGEYVPPTLVQSLETPGGLSHGVDRPPAERLISEATAAEVTESLVAVVNGGTGEQAAVNGYQVAGKTGTAWKVFDDGSGSLTYGSDGNRRYVVTFVGYLPADDPQLSLVVVVDEPKSDTTAAAIAAPLFSEIAGYGARILDIEPNQPVSTTDGERVRSTPAGLGSQAATGAQDWEAALQDSEATTESEAGP